MNKRVAIATDGFSPEQKTAFSKWVKSKGFGWWHWIQDFWLLTAPSERLDINEVINKLNEISPGSNKFVIEIPTPAYWTGFGPNTEERNMFTWLKETWDK